MKKLAYDNFKSNKNPSNGINLVALMDIFTVLVFFLIFNVGTDYPDSLKGGPSLPVSEMAINSIGNDDRITVMDISDVDTVIVENESYRIKLGTDELERDLQNMCLEPDSELCQTLVLRAPYDMDYPFVDVFVKLARKVGFNQVYLVVRQK